MNAYINTDINTKNKPDRRDLIYLAAGFQRLLAGAYKYIFHAS